ncbi:MAG: response regulator [Desulfobacterales bacterium]|nr:response regulator [Desulfobacterales bacterium]
MKQIIEWLIFIEDWANQIYDDLATRFIDDDDYFDFINRISYDENLHSQFMNIALKCLEQKPDRTAEIVLDRQTMNKVEDPLKKIENAVRTNQLDKPQILSLVLESELSEWNKIFLYVINSLKDNCPEFKTIVPSIQNHVRNIKIFVENMPNGSELLYKFKELPPVWEERILIVDDSEPIVDLLQSVLSGDGVVDVAKNGANGYEKASQNYYAAIISDLDMPVMGGIEFYKKLKQQYPDVGSRFIFISGAATQSAIDFINSEKIQFLSKPFKLHDIRKAVVGIIDKISM